MTWCVNYVNSMIIPKTCSCSRCNSYTSFLLLLHPVHGRAALVDLADLVGLARVVEDALRRRRLARVDVGHDADVAVVVHVDLAARGLADLDVGLGASGRDLRNDGGDASTASDHSL